MEQKKKCGIITFHQPLNYGAVLQAFALKHVLARWCDSFVLQHTNPRIARRHSIKIPLPKNKASLKQFFIKTVMFLPHYKKKHAFDRFCKNKLFYPTKEPEADFYITGSDQVWNFECTEFDKAYFLDFTTPEKKNAYSASFGIDTIPQEHTQAYQQLLGDFNNISVRENTARDMVKALIDRDVPVTLDPTLLLSEQEWVEACATEIKQKPYILVYTIWFTDSLIAFVNQLSAKTNLPVIVLSPEKSLFHKSGLKNAKFLAHLSPEKWVGYFQKASYVVTNSYHGTIFSINFNKQFFVQLLPPPANVNSRIVDVLDLFGLNDRYLDVVDIDKPIDFTSVNSILEREKKQSLAYLLSMVEDYHEKN